MRPLFLAAISLCLLGTAKGADRPNVIFLLADDQGGADLECYGSADLETPNLDALAARGIRFTRFYSAAPVCSPSRAGVLTGRYPVRAGVPNNCSSQKGGKGALPSEEVTMAEMFKGAGYATAQIGKWHLGYTPGTQPLAQGFDHAFGHMGGCIDNYSHFFYWSGPNIHDLWRNGEEVFHDGEFFPDLMVKEASRFIESNRDKPFFIYYAMNTPHYPYQGDAKWLERFAKLPYPRNLYAAFVAAQDERLGQLFAKLDELGLTDDTIIVFQSDNGHSTEERAHFGGGNAGPFRGAKFSLLEGGIHLPAIVSWPKSLPKGEVRDQTAHACDWMPTLAELCKVAVPDKPLDGLSLAAVLRDSGTPSPHEGKAVHWQIGDGPKADWAVLEGDWKLIGRSRDTSDGTKIAPLENFLVNLAEDPGETTNRAAEKPDLVERLTMLHRGHLQP